MKTVIRYVVTKPSTIGGRELFGAMQGRNTYETPDDAQKWIDSYMANNSASILDQFGRDMSVMPCECYPVHFDPIRRYFNEVQS